MYTDWLLKMKENEAQTTLEERVVELLAEHKMTVTTAESCTGGLIAATLVNVPLLKMKENEAQTTLEERVVELLAEHKMTVTTAESCTGGLIAATLVNVPGASDVLNEGYITYSNEAKIRLVNVSPETLERYGAVSWGI